VLDKTNFYAESGGQEYDTGMLISTDGKSAFVVENVQVYGGYVLHTGYLKYGSFSIDTEVECVYDALRRWPMRNNHTATHILNYALQNVLGGQIDQKGSLVVPEKLRFDYSSKAGPKIDQVVAIEAICNDFVSRNCQVYTREVPLSTAKSINGLRAVFGEVYPDPVRVVSVGFDIEKLIADPTNSEWANTSIEFCGGTHVAKTGDIKRFIILEESSIAKGIRRVVAVTGEEAAKAQQVAVTFSSRVAHLDTLKSNPDVLEPLMKSLSKELDEAVLPLVSKTQLKVAFAAIKKEYDDSEKTRKAKEAKEAVEAVKTYFEANPAVPVLVRVLETSSGKAISQALAHVKTLNEKCALFLAIDGAKVSHQCVVSKTFIEKGLKASEWAAAVALIVGGKCGGKDDSAQGAGTAVERVQEAVRVASEFAGKYQIS